MFKTAGGQLQRSHSNAILLGVGSERLDDCAHRRPKQRRCGAAAVTGNLFGDLRLQFFSPADFAASSVASRERVRVDEVFARIGGAASDFRVVHAPCARRNKELGDSDPQGVGNSLNDVDLDVADAALDS